jgi:hypothetical protein
VAAVLRSLETYLSGQSDLIIDYPKARGRNEPISTAVTERTGQLLLHRRWAPTSKALVAERRASDGQGPTSVMNGTCNKDYAAAQRCLRVRFETRHNHPQVLDGLYWAA